jgi:hypothetical protein
MKKIISVATLALLTGLIFGQTSSDVFNPGSHDFYWLGIDFSHVKMIGDFTQFGEAGTVDAYQIKNQYFPAWNNLVLNEPEKYDIKGMFKLDRLENDIDMITKINADANSNEMQATSVPNYTEENIRSFVGSYKTGGKSGIGLVFIAEVLDKNTPEGCFHVVAINMSNNDVLMWERISAKPGGFGVRNFWAGAVYNIIKEAKKSYYKSWKAKYGK